MNRFCLGLLASMVFLGGCPEPQDGEEPVDNSIPASFNSVMMTNTTIDPVTTMTRLDEPDADWSFYREFEDLEEGDCYDIAVSPNAVQRFLAYSTEGSDGQWRVAVRTGIGNDVWGAPDNDARIVVPEGPEFGCITPYINHVKDGLFGVLWIVNGTLYSAVFAPGNTQGFELTLGDSADGFMDDVSIRSVSLANFNDALRVIWMRPERDRIMQLRGQISATALTLFDGATFTPLDSSSHSDVVALEDGQAEGGSYGDGLYVAAAHEGEVTLYRSSGAGTDWTEVTSCESSWGISHSLLYADQDGDLRALLTGASITNQRTLSFADCSLEVLQVPIGNSGRITYSPGT